MKGICSFMGLWRANCSLALWRPTLPRGAKRKIAAIESSLIYLPVMGFTCER
jgi:hypothetical protein